jgi:hypothetical protein
MKKKLAPRAVQAGQVAVGQAERVAAGLQWGRAGRVAVGRAGQRVAAE